MSCDTVQYDSKQTSLKKDDYIVNNSPDEADDVCHICIDIFFWYYKSAHLCRLAIKMSGIYSHDYNVINNPATLSAYGVAMIYEIETLLCKI